MSSDRCPSNRAAARWVRSLAVTVTIGLLAAVGVPLGAFGKRFVLTLPDTAVGTAMPAAATAAGVETLTTVAGVVHAGSILVGVSATIGAVLLAVVLAVRVGAGPVA